MEAPTQDRADRKGWFLRVRCTDTQEIRYKKAARKHRKSVSELARELMDREADRLNIREAA